MSARDYTIDELANYLHVTPQQVVKMASRDQLPGRRINGQWKFSHSDIHHWFEDRIGESKAADLPHYDKLLRKADKHVDVLQWDELFVPEAIAKPLTARTRNSVIRDMCSLAARTGYLWDESEMRDAVAARENLHPTALESGVAMLHPRRPRGAILSQSLIAVGISDQSLPFGNLSGHLTDVFFLICSTDDAVHLRILAKLSRLVSDLEWLSGLRSCDSPAEVFQHLRASEERLSLNELYN